MPTLSPATLKIILSTLGTVALSCAPFVPDPYGLILAAVGGALGGVMVRRPGDQPPIPSRVSPDREGGTP